MARRLVDPLAKVAFAMSCLGGRATSWAYGRRLTDPTCFSTYESFKEELKLANGHVKTYLFREYPSTLEAAITLAMQEGFSLKQTKLHTNSRVSTTDTRY
ncbi:hypothetical protein PHMEG_00039474 [Phytophthora megakarya]|uniref:Retrotransposon gag domain-containing protein n=1 Tax=Phytophthora megakarya TaxID=4795 RepID=A0A225UFP6_9STRA|nr:hypothetical protein PHMEG_00039474 [Phytophthora megakarya]